MILKESVMTNRRRKASDVEATGKPPERGKLAISRRQANRQSEKGWRQNFQVEIPATESWRPVRLPDRNVGGSPPLQGNKNSCDTYTGENDKSDPDHADQNPRGCFRQGSIPHTAGNYDRDDHHADGVTVGAHSC